MHEDIQEVLFTEQQIQEKIKEIGAEISNEYSSKNLLLVNILKGGVVFLSDLMRYILIPHEIDFMAISSYGPSTESSGIVRVIKDLESDISNKDVLLVEDIVDTGLTLNYLMRSLEVRKPRSLKVCALLDKKARRIVETPLAFKGFDVPDVFVVGYGLDYKQKYRNLPFIGVLKSEVLP